MTILRHLIDQVSEDHIPLHIIQRRNGEAAILMAESDYTGLQETLYLLGNPVNAERLFSWPGAGVARMGYPGRMRKSGLACEAVVLDPQALEDLQWWTSTDKRTAVKVLRLVEETVRDPFGGRGKPEALKFDLAGCWSRRIGMQHRLVYEVTDNDIRVLGCRFHYR